MADLRFANRPYRTLGRGLRAGAVCVELYYVRSSRGDTSDHQSPLSCLEVERCSLYLTARPYAYHTLSNT